MNNGWIKLHRQFLEWEWYSDIPCKVLFLHLLITANHESKKWQGVIIERGDVVTGRIKLAEETRLTQRQVRTALTKLKSTNELTIKTTSQFSIITICNYDKYQSIATSGTTSNQSNERPASDQRTTTTKELKNERTKEYIYTDDFLRNWEQYPNKANKLKAAQAFQKISISVYPLISAALPLHVQSWAGKETKYIPHLATWLNGKRWEDVVSSSVAATQPRPFRYPIL
mgnify:CR=1 FL=1